ncbi:MAG: phospholipase D-like domain-containing protein [Nanoarchaeota archaeon]
MGKKAAVLAILILLVVIALIIPILPKPQPKAPAAATGISVWFCPEQPCHEVMAAAIGEAQQSVDCAFFELNEPAIMDSLDAKTDVMLRVSVDYRNPDENRSYLRYTNKSARGYMHNKFCIIDHMTVMTGSYNPTEKGGRKNYNNLVRIDSAAIADLYAAEFTELWSGTFGKGAPTAGQEGPVQAYFCPEDPCEGIVDRELDAASSSIHFMIYSFTNGEIGTHLLLAKDRGVAVEGMLEKQQISNYSLYKLFLYHNLSVLLENTGVLLHHKVFIIDNSTVITGSFNPSENAATRNDENLVIIHDPAIAAAFLEEYWELKSRLAG